MIMYFCMLYGHCIVHLHLFVDNMCTCSILHVFQIDLIYQSIDYRKTGFKILPFLKGYHIAKVITVHVMTMM